MCGVPASGKSHLAHALAELSGLPHLSSDVIRKRLAGLRPTERAPGETYSAEWNERTYAELGRRASGALAGERRRDRRRHVPPPGRSPRVHGRARRSRGRCVFIECQAPRPGPRLSGPRTASTTATASRTPGLAVVLREQSTWEPLDEVPASAHLTLRTDRPVEQITADVLALLDRRLAELALPDCRTGAALARGARDAHDQLAETALARPSATPASSGTVRADRVRTSSGQRAVRASRCATPP